MQEPLNPFLVEGYISSRYFCDRKEETSKLITALRNGRNVTLINPRRMGKSGLIHHAFAQMRAEEKDIKCFYIDLLHTQSLSEFINVFANAVFGELENSVSKLYKKINSVFRHCRPTISPDPVTGVPTFILNIDRDQEQHTLKEIFEYLKAGGKRIYIAFDEFQQITEYPEKGIEALLRSHIQFCPNINFIFAGSKKHMMHAIFYIPSRPFYQSTQTLPLSPIPKEQYFGFCHDFFSECGKDLTEEAFDYVYDSVMGHTWYVQYWMSKVFDDAPETIDIPAVRSALLGILTEEDDNFFTYTRLISPAQLKVIEGVAKARTIKAPFSSKKLTELGMGAPSTVRSCIKALTDKELLLEDRDVYSVYNRFFMLWLSQR